MSNRNRTKFKKWLEKVFYVENSLPATKVIDKDKVFFFLLMLTNITENLDLDTDFDSTDRCLC